MDWILLTRRILSIPLIVVIGIFAVPLLLFAAVTIFVLDGPRELRDLWRLICALTPWPRSET